MLMLMDNIDAFSRVMQALTLESGLPSQENVKCITVYFRIDLSVLQQDKC